MYNAENVFPAIYMGVGSIVPCYVFVVQLAKIQPIMLIFSRGPFSATHLIKNFEIPAW